MMSRGQHQHPSGQSELSNGLWSVQGLGIKSDAVPRIGMSNRLETASDVGRDDWQYESVIHGAGRVPTSFSRKMPFLI